jgi:hypothetical protein
MNRPNRRLSRYLSRAREDVQARRSAGRALLAFASDMDTASRQTDPDLRGFLETLAVDLRDAQLAACNTGCNTGRCE